MSEDNKILDPEDGLYAAKKTASISAAGSLFKGVFVSVNIHEGELWVYDKKKRVLSRGGIALLNPADNSLFKFFEKYTP